jgi:hypothetical protein
MPDTLATPAFSSKGRENPFFIVDNNKADLDRMIEAWKEAA